MDERRVEDESLGARALDILESAATGLPAPVKKGATAAFLRLCAAGAELPAAWLEGRAAEIRAASEARVRLTLGAADQIVSGLSVDPRFAERASVKFAEKIVREQLNIDKVALLAAEDLTDHADAPSDGALEAGPTADWLDRFATEAGTRSAEDVSRMFGRILAGEIRSPGSFSIRTIRAVSELDQYTAQVFARFAACSISIPFLKPHERLCNLGHSVGLNSLATYGLSYIELVRLQEAGLLQPDLESIDDYSQACIGGHGLSMPFMFQGHHYFLGPGGADMAAQLSITGPAVTIVGHELLRIVDCPPQEAYRSALFNYLRARGYTIMHAEVERRDNGAYRFHQRGQVTD